MRETLLAYIPENSAPLVEYLIKKYAINLKIVNERQTKHGDFRTFANGKTQITVNNNLNKYQFLLTLVHEIAHHVTYEKFGRVQPHGKEWKTVFQHLMIPFLRPDIYPNHILPLLANHFKNPKASTDSDPKLSLALKGNTAEIGKNFVFEIPEGSIFRYKKNTYKMGKRRRTRYECLNLSTQKVYLFNQNIEVSLIKNNL
ncbi:SprT-like domain-containing protein [uncultured Tenacibaculum sp.]|uniref:SprT-like domain-containing protein n=1 Tax=uncultured Tenacibaculum sp. TaxID=174713 RepID=UPI0026368096|nr:SprT-like domain-containing protein [uncultured Tenacibaculum sp.]